MAQGAQRTTEFPFFVSFVFVTFVNSAP